jgi:hypothetical protein
MRGDSGQVSEMRPDNLKPIQEPVKATDLSLVPYQCLWGPRMGGVNHRHPLNHHESVHDAARRREGAYVGPNCAKFADKGVPNESLGKEEASCQVSVTRPERTPHPNAVLVIRDIAGQVVERGCAVLSTTSVASCNLSTVNALSACSKSIRRRERG